MFLQKCSCALRHINNRIVLEEWVVILGILSIPDSNPDFSGRHYQAKLLTLISPPTLHQRFESVTKVPSISIHPQIQLLSTESLSLCISSRFSLTNTHATGCIGLEEYLKLEREIVKELNEQIMVWLTVPERALWSLSEQSRKDTVSYARIPISQLLAKHHIK